MLEFFDFDGNRIGSAQHRGHLYIGTINGSYFWCFDDSNLLQVAQYQYHNVAEVIVT